MSAKWKLFTIAIAAALTASMALGILIARRQPTAKVSEAVKNPQQTLPAYSQVSAAAQPPERDQYQPIALETISSVLQGSDPAAIALNAFGSMESEGGTRQVEVAYPQANQAVVIITQTGLADDSVAAIKYRVELSTFGRSILVTSPRVWQMVWAGSQVKCRLGRGEQNWSTKNCH
jgi:hypothetical protein